MKKRRPIKVINKFEKYLAARARAVAAGSRLKKTLKSGLVPNLDALRDLYEICSIEQLKLQIRLRDQRGD